MNDLEAREEKLVAWLREMRFQAKISEFYKDNVKFGMKSKALPAIWHYVIYSYLLFWVMIIGLGGVVSMVFHAPPAVMNGIAILCSWSPTIVLWLMSGKLKPGMTIGMFDKQTFREKIQVSLPAVIPVLVFGIFPVAVWLLSLLQKTSFTERSYLRLEFKARFGFLKGSLVLGLVWTFWHFPLWFIASAFSGSKALMYFASNLVVMTALTIIMGLFMKPCDNLFISFWIHFCFNFSLGFFTGDVYFFVGISVLYIATVLVLLVSFRKYLVHVNKTV
ncbi:MAG: CPBP family intramembrane glutamate endopeptidase [Clostridia bacterium]